MPRNNFDVDYDFIGFTYNNYHSIDDLKIYRVSDGKRYDLGITPTSKDVTAEVPDGDGQYFFESWHTKKDITIQFAFDDLTDEDLRTLANVFNGMEEHELVFDEWPHKAYDAVVSQPVQINYICFDKPDGSRVYKGDGTILFTCHCPYAHTPKNTIGADNTTKYTLTTAVSNIELTKGTYAIVSNGTIHPSSVEIISNDGSKHWKVDLRGTVSTDFVVDSKVNIASVITYWEVPVGSTTEGWLSLHLSSHEIMAITLLLRKQISLIDNSGDLPAPFVFTYSGEIQYTTTMTVGDAFITVYGTEAKKYTDFEWRSDTGLVLAKTNGGPKKPIFFTGNSRAAIPTGNLRCEQIFVNPILGAQINFSNDESCPIKLNYIHWYY